MTFDPQILDLYEAIANLESWDLVGDILARLTGLDAAGVWITQDGAVADMTQSAASRNSIKPYLDYYHALDPWQRGLATSPREKAFLACEHTSEAEVVKTEFYNDFARHFGMLRPIGAMLTLAPGVRATACADPTFTNQLLSEHDKASFEKLLPFMKRALQLRRRLQELKAIEAVKSAALDATTSGILSCDVDGHILFANAAAQDMLRSDSGLKSGPASTIRAPSKNEEARLLALIRDAASGGPGGSIRLCRSDGVPNLLVLVAPGTASMDATIGMNVAGRLARHAIVLAKPASGSETFFSTTMMQLFDLTEAQATIAVQLHRGLSPEDIAAQRGVKISTVRTQVVAILRRTGSESLRDLARLLGRIPILK